MNKTNKATITMECRPRVNQEELDYTYWSSVNRLNSHQDIYSEYNRLVESQHFYDNEKDALRSAIERVKSKSYECQIWVTFKKENDTYKLQNHWIVTDDWKIKMCAEYVGMFLAYDYSTLQKIIYHKISIEDIVNCYR